MTGILPELYSANQAATRWAPLCRPPTPSIGISECGGIWKPCVWSERMRVLNERTKSASDVLALPTQAGPQAGQG